MVNKNVKKAIESLYEGKCNVYGYGTVTDNKSHLTNNKEYMIFKDIPCRLSVKNVVPSNQGEPVNSVLQEIKLFLNPDYEIKPGCKIVVTQNGITEAYKNSSQPNVKSNHQEISLELFKEWT